MCRTCSDGWAGIVKVPGTVGRSKTEASIRVEEPGDADTTTPSGNLALNKDGIDKPKEWPRTLAYFSSQDDPAHRTTDGVKDFVSSSAKKIWCDWERDTFHTL